LKHPKQHISAYLMPGKNQDIEKLRAVAILLVVLWHYSGIVLAPLGISTHFLGSWTGVDLFFCISGYVIMKSLIGSIGEQGIGRFLSGFYIKRIFRIWPSAVGCICAALAMAYLAGKYIGPDFYNDTKKDAVPALLNYANWAFYYKTANHGGTLLGIFWSLSLEEQFYLIIPLLAWFFRRRLLLFSFMLSIPAVWQFCLHRESWKVLAWSLRTDALIFGVIIAIIEMNFAQHLSTFGQNLAIWGSYVSNIMIPCLILILATIASDYGARFSTLSVGWAGVVSAVLVAIAATNRGLVLNHGMISPMLLWIGGRSFSIYLFHNFALVIAKGLNLSVLHLSLDPRTFGYYWMIISTLLLLGVFCEANYRLIEIPLRNIGRRLAG
jgi:peptidoglycan/LPS O-acetylase OafA/YrhL